MAGKPQGADRKALSEGVAILIRTDKLPRSEEVAYCTIRRHWGSWQAYLRDVKEAARQQGWTAGQEQDERDLAEEGRQRLEDENRLLKEELRTIRRENIAAAMVRQEMLGLSEKVPDVPAWAASPRRGAKDPAVPTLFLSDLHWGERVAAEEVNGRNEYNLATARKRLRYTVQRAIQFCDGQPYDYPGVVLGLGGDMVGGDIHEELARTNDAPVLPAVLDLYGCLIWAIEALADRFGRVFVPAVAGNHGRLTHRPTFKQRHATNLDWFLYQLLERHFQADDRVTVRAPAETDVDFAIYGHRYCLTHGDNLGVAGGDGIIGALGPICRGAIKVGNQKRQLGLDFDTLLMGHWHQWIPLPNVIVNGSLKGWDEYARLRLRAPYSRPSQGLWWTHPGHGIGYTMQIYSDEIAKQKGQEWVTWAA